jgi:NAD(P)-dependent dehydrogenase (short-subunit alcohol dehydrogenase family)
MTASTEATREGRLRGKRVLVTGAGAGIGRACALAFAREAAFVAVSDLDIEAARQTAAGIAADSTALALDVTRADSVAEAVRVLSRTAGGIDAVMHCAADVKVINGADRRLTELDEDVWQRMINLHLTGAFLVCKHVGKQMIGQGRGGSILLCGTVDALLGVAGLDSYTAAKGGVHAMARSFAAGIAAERVRVNVICPSFVETETQRQWLAKPSARRLIDGLHMLDVPQPEDIAALAVYLVSDESRAVTGASFPVDAGYSAFKARVDVMAAMSPEDA